jgi:EmrB/QacA subfamily drug resistance transporter
MKEQSTSSNKGLLVLCIAAFLVPFMGSSLNLALPQISKVFSMNAVTLTWMSTAYLISTAIFQVPFAKVGDMIGRKKIFLGGVFIFSTCTFLCCLAPNQNILILLRFLSGIGSAMLFSTSMAILTSLFPPAKRGAALGINSAVVYAALAVGPFLGGVLTKYLGWQSIFIVAAMVGFSVIILSYFFLKGEWVESKGEKFDTIGAIVYAFGLFALIYGFSNLPKTFGIIWLFAGIISFSFFIFWEKKSLSPIFNIKLFSGNRVFLFSSLAALINYAATSAIAFMLSLYLQFVRGFEPSTAGLILISQASVQSIFALWAGKLSDRIPPSRLATAGMIIIVLTLAGLITLSPTTPMWMIILLLVFLGIGFGIFSSPNTNVIMSSVDKKYYGQASATTGTVRLTGQAFSMGIAGMAFSMQMGSARITPEVYPLFMRSLQITFIIFLALCLIGVFASAVRNKK